MFSFLSGWVGKGLIAGIGITVLLAAAWKIESDIEALGAAKATIATLQQTNQQNVAELAKLQADYKRATDALNAQAAQDNALTQEQATDEQKIRNAPAADRGSVPGVILHTIDGLYNR